MLSAKHPKKITLKYRCRHKYSFENRPFFGLEICEKKET